MKSATRIHSGKPLPFDRVLAMLTGLPDADVDTVIRIGGAYVGKHRVTDPNRLIRPGDMVSAYWQYPLAVSSLVFDPKWIVASPKGLLVARKPAGVPTQGMRDRDINAFYPCLQKHLKGYVGLHHRLDRGTSGLLLFTRDKAYNKAVAALFQGRHINKIYLAVASGSWPFESQDVLIDQPLMGRRHAEGTIQVVDPKGKKARTMVTCLVEAGGLVLLCCRPITGRTHQIRVHLAHAGMPLLGDTYYGGPPCEQGFFLHCAGLSWPDQEPVTANRFFEPPDSRWETVLKPGWRQQMEAHLLDCGA